MTPPQPYAEGLMAFKGEHAWKDEARTRAIAELEVQLRQAGFHGSEPGFSAFIGMLVDAVIGTAMPYLEASWRDAVLKMMWRQWELPGEPRPPT